MIKYAFLLITILSISACSAHDPQYYREHPRALQQAIQQCPEKPPSQVSCDQLFAIAATMNDLAEKLRSDRQGFGKAILALQETIAQQQSELRLQPKQPELDSSLKENQMHLQEHLAVVKWLESPES